MIGPRLCSVGDPRSDCTNHSQHGHSQATLQMTYSVACRWRARLSISSGGRSENKLVGLRIGAQQISIGHSVFDRWRVTRAPKTLATRRNAAGWRGAPARACFFLAFLCLRWPWAARAIMSVVVLADPADVIFHKGLLWLLTSRTVWFAGTRFCICQRIMYATTACPMK